jgi:hypothetical protein
MLELSTSEAVYYVMKKHNLTKYAIAVQVGAAPTSAYQWARNTRMSEYFAAEFERVFNVYITDRR